MAIKDLPYEYKFHKGMWKNHIKRSVQVWGLCVDTGRGSSMGFMNKRPKSVSRIMTKTNRARVSNWVNATEYIRKLSDIRRICILLCLIDTKVMSLGKERRVLSASKGSDISSLSRWLCIDPSCEPLTSSQDVKAHRPRNTSSFGKSIF